MKMTQPIYFILFLTFCLSQSNAQEIQILNYVDHGEVFVADTIRYADGNSIYVTRLEIRGAWAGSDSPSPSQALNWFADTNDDNPLAALDWANVVIDTSWTDNGDTTFSAADNIRKRYRNGAWDATPVTTGWMAEDEVYTIEVQSVTSGTPTTLETFVFDLNTELIMMGKGPEHKLQMEMHMSVLDLMMQQDLLFFLPEQSI